MAKEFIVRCDAAFTIRPKDCGEVHPDTRTFTIRSDGEAWEIDLGGPHAEALMELARRGREVSGDVADNNLNRRIRGVPTAADRG